VDAPTGRRGLALHCGATQRGSSLENGPPRVLHARCANTAVCFWSQLSMVYHFWFYSSGSNYIWYILQTGCAFHLPSMADIAMSALHFSFTYNQCTSTVPGLGGALKSRSNEIVSPPLLGGTMMSQSVNNNMLGLFACGQVHGTTFPVSGEMNVPRVAGSNPFRSIPATRVMCICAIN
jgi:hypothetical protein